MCVFLSWADKATLPSVSAAVCYFLLTPLFPSYPPLLALLRLSPNLNTSRPSVIIPSFYCQLVVLTHREQESVDLSIRCLSVSHSFTSFKVSDSVYLCFLSVHDLTLDSFLDLSVLPPWRQLKRVACTYTYFIFHSVNLYLQRLYDMLDL